MASPTPMHAAWRRQVRPRLAQVDLELLTAVVRPAGYLPDFLLPVPAGRTQTLQAGLAAVTTADPAVVSAELAHLARHPLAQQGPGRRTRQLILRNLSDAPHIATARLAAELERYWQVAVAPWWPRIEAVTQADRTYRLEQVGAGGVQRLLQTLHPSVRLRGHTLTVEKYFRGRAQAAQRGLVLVPSVFGWPEVVVRTADPQPVLTYPARGGGTGWLAGRPLGPALDIVLGRSRAAILARLDPPISTTALARELYRSAPTINAHLKALAAAGLITAHRTGRQVLYHRTALGDLLLEG